MEAEYKRIYNLNKVIWLPQPMLEDDDYRLGILDEKEDGTPVFGMSFAAHIDEMCRFITPNKILLAEVSDEEAASSKAGAESRRRIDAAYEILRAETDWEGKPFEIVRMPTAEPIEVVIAPGDEDYELYKGFIDEMGGKFMDGTPWPEGPVHFLCRSKLLQLPHLQRRRSWPALLPRRHERSREGEGRAGQGGS